jgi:hypothetical protein
MVKAGGRCMKADQKCKNKTLKHFFKSTENPYQTQARLVKAAQARIIKAGQSKGNINPPTKKNKKRAITDYFKKKQRGVTDHFKKNHKTTAPAKIPKAKAMRMSTSSCRRYERALRHGDLE